MLAGGGEDGSVRVWSVPEWKMIHRLKGHEVAVYGVTFSPDSATLAAACGNNLIVFWNPQTGQLKRLLKETMTISLRQL